MYSEESKFEETPFLDNGKFTVSGHKKDIDGEKGQLGSMESSLSGPIEEHHVERGVWSNKCQFFLAIMGYTIGIGSVWRFPIICR